MEIKFTKRLLSERQEGGPWMLQAMKSYRKDTEHVLLEYPFKYGKNNKVVRSNQQEFTKAKSHLTKLNACEDELRSSMNE